MLIDAQLDYSPSQLPPYFQKRITLATDGSGCWLWTGPTRNEYGVAFVGYHYLINGKVANSKAQYAHREVYRRLVAPDLAPFLDCHHLCHNIRCVNPTHIEILTRSVHLSGHRRAERARCHTVGELVYLKIIRRAANRAAARAWKLAHPERAREQRLRSEARCRDARNARRRARAAIRRAERGIGRRAK